VRMMARSPAWRRWRPCPGAGARRLGQADDVVFHDEGDGPVREAAPAQSPVAVDMAERPLSVMPEAASHAPARLAPDSSASIGGPTKAGQRRASRSASGGTGNNPTPSPSK